MATARPSTTSRASPAASSASASTTGPALGRARPSSLSVRARPPGRRARLSEASSLSSRPPHPAALLPDHHTAGINSSLKPAPPHRELWLVRHGETPASRGRHLAGWTDVPLTDRGEAQAAALEPLFHSTHFDGVWSSDLVRAVTTARLARGEPVPDRRLREIHFGDLEGVGYAAMDEGDRDALLGFEGFAAPGGESFDQLRARVLSFVDGLPPGRHALFTHGGVVRVLAREVGEDRFVPTGTLIVVDWEARSLLSIREGEGTPRDDQGAVIER